AGAKRCRLVAVRAASGVANERRRKRKCEAKKTGKAVCRKGLVRDGWHLMVTNLCGEELAPQKLAAVYRARWGVEIQFRAWKQSCHLDAGLNRRSKESHLRVIVIAGMIAHLIGMHVGRLFASKIGIERLSYEKLYDLLALHHIRS